MELLTAGLRFGIEPDTNPNPGMLLLLMGSEPETTMRRRETGFALDMVAGACFDGREWLWLWLRSWL